MPGGAPLYKPYRVCAAPMRRVFAPFWSENGSRLCPVWFGNFWNRVWFSRKLRESMNVFIGSIPNE